MAIYSEFSDQKNVISYSYVELPEGTIAFLLKLAKPGSISPVFEAKPVKHLPLTSYEIR